MTGSIPRDYVAFKITVPDGDAEEMGEKTLKTDWESDLAWSRAVGDGWLAEGRSLALVVPSAVLPDSRNILLNPLHPRASRLRVVSQKPFTFDPRLGPTR